METCSPPFGCRVRRCRCRSCGSLNRVAAQALKEAQARQLDVPAQLALCGYTDSPTATIVQPPLTMVSVPAREIGIRAMQRLADLIQGKTIRPRRTTLPVELILRDSCGHH
jgi:LacI family transcriptional regulator, galactose operon repressor